LEIDMLTWLLSTVAPFFWLPLVLLACVFVFDVFQVSREQEEKKEVI
jgi:hypothetical protein